MNTKNWLASIFEWNREVIEAAETPFAKLAIFVLPIISPIVPASMTGLHIYKLMRIIFDFGGWTGKVSVSMAVIVGVVLELIGYVGVISFIQNIYQWIKTRRDEFLVPAILNGLAYGFYLVAMWAINYQLGKYFDTPEIVNNIVGLLSFITVPTGLLAANHLSERAEEEKSAKLRQEKNDFKLRQRALDKGIVYDSGNQAAGTRKPKPASAYQTQIVAYLNEEFKATGRVLSPREITDKINKEFKSAKLEHENAKGYISTQTTKWKKENNIMGF